MSKFCRVSDCNIEDCVLEVFDSYWAALNSLGPGEWVELLTPEEIEARTF